MGRYASIYLIAIGIIYWLTGSLAWNKWLTRVFLAALTLGIITVWWITWNYGRHAHQYEHIGYTAEDRIFAFALLSLLFAQVILVINFLSAFVKQVKRA